MHDRLFAAALGITLFWSVMGVQFDEAAKVLTVVIDFAVGSRFAVKGVPSEHAVHDTVTKTCRHLNFFQHECLLQVPHGADEAARWLGADGQAAVCQATPNQKKQNPRKV